MAGEAQKSSHDVIVTNAVFVIFMLWLFLSKNQWGHFIFFLTVGNSWTDCSCTLSFLPQIKNAPSFLGVEKEFVWFDSSLLRMVGGSIIYPALLFEFSQNDLAHLFPYIGAGFVCGIIFRKTVATIFYYLDVLPTIVLVRIVDYLAAFLSRHQSIRRTLCILISCTLFLFIGFRAFLLLFPHNFISSSSSQAQYYEEPRQGEEVSKESETVWVPTHGGTKYHRRSTCSGMEDPEKTTKEDAISRGFEACQRCY